MARRIVEAERREFRLEYGGGEFVLPYRVFFPTGYKEKKNPLLLYMHGFGECGTENEKQLGVLGGKNVLLDLIAERDDCVIVAPQCRGVPSEYAWVDINNKWDTGSRVEPGVPTLPMRAAMALIKEFSAAAYTDASRVYLAGLSMGGYAAWELLVRLPTLFAAAIAVCGAGFPALADRIKDIPIRAFHGSLDTTVPPSGTKDMEEALKRVGGNITATYLDGYAHSIWDPAFGTEGLTEWLFSQRKDK